MFAIALALPTNELVDVGGQCITPIYLLAIGLLATAHPTINHSPHSLG
ncbi:MAG: hypothetical protein F6K56_24050 [Moorea sp. SIO3G5]|nr:hypothetical protein [Moorena sp. SIO3G5]